MTDRPIIFSAPMVRALIAGRKTQTRRLTSSPMARVVLGDRLWVRESLLVYGDGISYRADDAIAYDVVQNHVYHAGRDLWLRKACDKPVGVPSIHMPRWASRLTLIVEAVKVEPVHLISEHDAEAEGVVWDSADGLDVWYVPGAGVPHAATAAECYSGLWNALHETAGERWEDGPAVVAISFRVEHRNIDAA